MMLMGMANPITKVVLPVRRNRKRIVTARMLPIDQIFLHQVDGTVDVVRFVIDLKQFEASTLEDPVV